MESPKGMLDVYIDASEIMQHGVMWIGEKGHIIDVNPRFAKDLGYSKENFKLQTIFEVNPNMTLLNWRKLWAELLDKRQIDLETEQITSDDIIYPVSMRGVLIEAGDNLVCMGIVDNLNQVNRYQDLLNLTSKIAKIGSWQLDVDTNEFLLSEEMYRLLDLPKIESLKFENFKEMLSRKLAPVQKEKLFSKIEASLQTGEAFEMEMSIAQQSGEHLQFRFFLKTEEIDGKVSKISGVLQDISKIGERTNEMYFMQFCMDNASYAILWENKAGQIIYVNKAAEKLYGYTKEELLQMQSKQITTTSNYIWEEQSSLVKKHPGVKNHKIHRKKSGDLVPVAMVGHYLEYRGEIFMCSFIRDFTEQKIREEKLMLASQTLKYSNDLIVWINYDSSFVFFNNTFIEKTGYSESELKKMKLLDLVPTTSLQQFQKGWKSLHPGKSMVIEREIFRKNGTKISAEMTASRVEVDRKEYCSVIFRDISKEKERIQEIERLNNNLTEENILLKEELDFDSNFSNIISTDPAYKPVLQKVAQVADTDATVLILGETGTGKELLARATHEMSDRCDMPMIKVNCGALPENLIESELFGHEKGAFTGAVSQKIGKFERADGGTIFLDEIGELPLDLQTQLLRVLQEGEIERVGGTKTLNVDVRIIAATNRNLEEEVAKGKFRADLYYRLNVFPIINLPLRERLKDVPVLVKYFVEKFNKRFNKNVTEIPPNVLKALHRYDFPGNIRELENMIERALIVSKSKVLAFDTNMLLSNNAGSGSLSKKFLTLDQAQTEHIIAALRKTKGKVSGDGGAAALLDLNDKTLVSRMKKLGIDKRDYLDK